MVLSSSVSIALHSDLALSNLVFAMLVPAPDTTKNNDAIGECPSTPLLEFNQFPDILIALSETGLIRTVNKAFEEVLMYATAEVEGKPLQSFVAPNRSSELNQLINEAQQHGVVRNLDIQLIRKDGATRDIGWTARWYPDSYLILAIGRDNTELVRPWQKQDSRENMFQALIENSFDLLGLTDAEGKYLYLSDTFTEIFGYDTKEMLGKVCFSYMHPDDLPRIMSDNIVLHSQAKKIYVAPYRFRHASGKWLWVESVVTNQLNHPDIRGVVISARDITNQIDTEAKLKEMQLIEALQEGEEKERSRIARDLHDEISGMIAAAKMHFGSLTIHAPQFLTLGGYQQGMELLENASHQIRRTSHNLMPEILLENGLSTALQRYCCSVSSNGLQIDFFSLGENRRYSSVFELSFYRIAQEIIGNILKHSQATSALVQLSQTDSLLSLVIEDDGKGFNPETQMNGTGLASIRRRVNAMKGTFEISSKAGQGTQVYLEFES